ncbi:hypothetical protein AR158_c582L [Paramecium bursaria Chlorella virus AR158]|uniref:hypothetical protein n=1 Tax=Paramecium bursaria Chlorella virus AR158 TaxID=380598 RepID=UPI00015AA794|nr:hypothetical protein AR158_c582L [Paramecium bursaria Chlorella virus AR158]ABU44127.1 hypothetical protein AR158_c582L [Paramecium bursaria Chlorella virus AR158]
MEADLYGSARCSGATDAPRTRWCRRRDGWNVRRWRRIWRLLLNNLNKLHSSFLKCCALVAKKNITKIRRCVHRVKNKKK